MKFGKFIQAQAEEWAADQYLNYKALKKILKSGGGISFSSSGNSNSCSGGIAITAPSSAAAGPMETVKTAFFFRLERELEKINTFYLQKEQDFSLRLDSYIQKKKRLLSRKAQNPSEIASLIEAFHQFHQDLAKLQKYVELNATGFRKILKKWDKLAKSNTKEIYLSRQVEIQPCFNGNVLTRLTDSATKHLSELEKLLDDISSNDNSTSHGIAATAGMAADGTPVSQEDIETTLSRLVMSSENKEQIQKIISNASLISSDKDLVSRVFLKKCSEADESCLLLLLPLVNVNFVHEITERTCLHFLAISCRLALFMECCSHGASVNVPDIYGKLPLHYASMHGSSQIIAFLLEKNQGIVDATDAEGVTPLVYAIKAKHTESVRILLEKGASVDVLLPLSVASQHGNLEIVQMLLDRGARDTSNSEGLTALHFSVRQGHDELIDILIRNGSDVNAKDSLNGWTPLFYACSEGRAVAVQELLKRGADKTVADEGGWIPWTYALYHGYLEIAQLVKVDNFQPIVEEQTSKAVKPIVPSALFEAGTPTLQNNQETDDFNIDAIPSLELPPPIIPFRIYGHSYLESTCLVQISFPWKNKTPITLSIARKPSAFKVNVKTVPDMNIPLNLVLPLKDHRESFTFQIHESKHLSLVFDVFPIFGSNLVARGVVNLVADRLGHLKVPLLAPNCEIVGELECKLDLIMPFEHEGLSIGGKVDTYWKSTSTAAALSVTGTPRSGDAKRIPSFVTATSLHGDYIELLVKCTSDYVPVVASSINIGGISLDVASLSSDDVSKFARKLDLLGINRIPLIDLAQILNGSACPLDLLLSSLPTDFGFNIRVEAVSSHAINRDKYIDSILKTVYDHADLGRQIIFSSFDIDFCARLNWKQPNYGVLVGLDIGNGMSLKDAVYFAKMNHLLGLLVNAKPLIEMPLLIEQIKESGLLLCTFGTENSDSSLVKKQQDFSVDAFLANQVFRYRHF